MPVCWREGGGAALEDWGGGSPFCARAQAALQGRGPQVLLKATQSPLHTWVWFSRVGKCLPPSHRPRPRAGWTRRVPALSSAHPVGRVMEQVIQLMLSPYKGLGPSKLGVGPRSQHSRGRLLAPREMVPSFLSGLAPSTNQSSHLQLVTTCLGSHPLPGPKEGAGLATSLSYTYRPTWKTHTRKDVGAELQGCCIPDTHALNSRMDTHS